ncbi:LysE/ArgO family amino acid transporter [Paenibacillus qinlingensis]|uniref:L-lysine exporter family protein LysE/ArgO n=1 Tax=Paenibacillus qinlingensis TaxID=1837343 RepID=A0ABU1NRC6_9BACL|nr:LysE/ArgO family amino acid transporter [Paenibacillus qinlingensis]MDR6549973.1 L-lysine exporter family protein LysE/ArgO [Paenibacillus qinlingensis]
MLTAIVQGILLSAGLILPLGVQNVFVFNQGVTQPNFIRALPVVLTAALCDTVLISLAILGVSVVIVTIPAIKIILFALGIVFLIYMGILTWKSKPASSASEEAALSPKRQIAFAASVSLLNPHAILDTIGVIGTSSIHYSGTEKLVFAVACIGVSWIWFIALALMGRQVGRLDQSRTFITYLNKASALIMWGTSIYLITQLI